MRVPTYDTKVLATGPTPGEAVEKLAQTVLVSGLERDGKFAAEVSLVQYTPVEVWQASVWVPTDLGVE